MGGPRIVGFRGRLGFCSNFTRRGLWLDGQWYKTREHAYQVGKFLDPATRKLIQETHTPTAAKMLAKKLKSEVRPDWYAINLEYMELVVKTYFDKWEDHRKRLLDTGDEHLEEVNTWGDTFYGTVNGVGDNHLGRILMKLRAAYRAALP
jgi:ribA/ribD-fused uncharacterized protein